MNQHPAFEDAAQFADDLTSTIQGVFPDSAQLEVRELRGRVVIGLFDDEDNHRPFALKIGGRHVANWMLTMGLDLDSRKQYLKVMKSNFSLSARADRTPLVRYEFDDAMHTAPVAHWQFHGERGAFSHLLGQAQAVGREVTPHSLSSLHFPVGGSRLRPGVDDWLEFLVQECAFDADKGWQTHVESSRRRYRTIQARTIARDMQCEAADVLREAGWRVEPPEQGAPEPSAKYLERW